jgi:penicillin-binding protein 2
MKSTIGAYHREGEVFKKRLGIIPIFIVVAFSILLLKIVYLQLVEGEKFRNLSENNWIRIKRVAALRGMILDRKGEILVDNRPSFVLSIIPEDVKDLDKTFEKIGLLTLVDKDQLVKKFREGKGNPPFVPVRLIEDLSWEMMGKLEVNRLNLPGVIVDVLPRRYYPHGKFAAHLLGYLGEITDGELKKGAFQGYRPGDLIGRFGVEQKFEISLKGRDGGKQVEVDAAGRELKVISEVLSLPGNNLILTLDVIIQKAVEEALGTKSGAVVVGDRDSSDNKPSFF